METGTSVFFFSVKKEKSKEERLSSSFLYKNGKSSSKNCYYS